MNVFIYYRGKSAPSARALHASLKENSDHKFIRGTTKSKFLRRMKFDVLINVGNSQALPVKNIKHIINPPASIRMSANKKQARIRFKAKGIPAPKLWMDASIVPKKEFPVVGRTSYHMKAKGFWYCRSYAEAKKAQLKGATHFLKFIKNTREFRAHVFSTVIRPKSIDDYVIAKLSEKRRSEKSDSSIIKNHEHGYKFVAPLKNSSPIVLDRVRQLAKEALLKFNLNYGGVDIVYSLNTKKAYVLEINSTPCLTDEVSSTLDTYTEKFVNLIKTV